MSRLNRVPMLGRDIQADQSLSSTGYTRDEADHLPLIGFGFIDNRFDSACSLPEVLAADFEREGGFTERLYRVRSGRR